MTQTETRKEEKTERGTTGYTILKRIEDIDTLAGILEKGDAEVYAVYAKDVQGRDGNAALKKATIGENTVDEGRYVPVATSGFKPRDVVQVVQVQLG